MKTTYLKYIYKLNINTCMVTGRFSVYAYWCRNSNKCMVMSILINAPVTLASATSPDVLR